MVAYDDEGNPAPGISPVWVPYTDGLGRYSATFGGWPTGESYNIAVQAVSETDRGEAGNGDTYIVSDYMKLTEIGGSGRYSAVWEEVPGAVEYVLTLKNGSEVAP